jgi:hypothetical protein
MKGNTFSTNMRDPRSGIYMYIYIHLLCLIVFGDFRYFENGVGLCWDFSWWVLVIILFHLIFYINIQSIHLQDHQQRSSFHRGYYSKSKWNDLVYVYTYIMNVYIKWNSILHHMKIKSDIRNLDIRAIYHDVFYFSRILERSADLRERMQYHIRTFSTTHFWLHFDYFS